MAKRTFAVGDIHGDYDQLYTLLTRLPPLDAEDTLVFLGDYLDRGPRSADVVSMVREVLPRECPAKVVALRGNHEDAWLRVRGGGFDQFVMPPSNGALACMRSYTGGDVPGEEEHAKPEERDALFTGAFLPDDVVEWMSNLPYFYEDDHAIYVHAGLPRHSSGRFLHPSEVTPPEILLWIRTEAFFLEYVGKRVVVGHTTTDCLPQELSLYTPADPTDLWAGEHVCALDTGCGKGGFLTALELPSLSVYESR
jgi:serine/threonine protein phosphatase 1